MKATIFAAALLLVAGLARVDTQSTGAQSPSVGRALSGAPGEPDRARPTLDRYCVTCHNQRAKIGGLALEGLDPSAAGRDPQTWEKVVRKVRTGMMPPSGAPRPDRATLDGLAASIEQAIDRV